MSDTDDYFLQPKIAGYRKLSREEAELINEIKAVGTAFEAVFKKVRTRIATQHAEASVEETIRLAAAEPERWAAMGRSDAQTAVMKLCRAVAQPAS